MVLPGRHSATSVAYAASTLRIYKGCVMARRKRTTIIWIAVPTTFKEVGKLLKVSPGTIAQRFHRLHDAHPRSAIKLDSLATSHKTKQFRGKY